MGSVTGGQRRWTPLEPVTGCLDGADAGIGEVRREDQLLRLGEVGQGMTASRLGERAVLVEAHAPVRLGQRDDRAMRDIADIRQAVVARRDAIADMAGRVSWQRHGLRIDE